jgi:hypothetical protein
MSTEDPVARIVAEFAELPEEDRARCVERVVEIHAERERWRWMKRRDTAIRDYCAAWHSDKSPHSAAQHIVKEIAAYEVSRWRIDRARTCPPTDPRTAALHELMTLGGVPGADHIRKHILVGHRNGLNAQSNHRNRQ